ncbi:regulatory protein GemA, partial [Haemophilus influenzae]|nr:regulatory protein GemA [Haemophilus influenzae]
MLRKNLIAKIHIGKSQLGLDDETYRQLLVSTTGKTSCTEMTESELQQVLNIM